MATSAPTEKSGVTDIIRDQKKNDQELERERSQKRTTKSYTDEDSGLVADKIHVYYCKQCGAYSMVLGQELETLPKRRTDGARAVTAEQVKKKSVVEGDVKLVRRGDSGAERQYRYNCPGCGVFVGYQSTDFKDSSAVFYALPGSFAPTPNILESQLPSCIQATEDNNIRLHVEVELDQRDTKIVSVKDQVLVHLRGSLRDPSRANEVMIDVLSRVLSIKKSQISLEWGGQTKNKVFILTAVSAKKVATILEEYAHDENKLAGFDDDQK